MMDTPVTRAEFDQIAQGQSQLAGRMDRVEAALLRLAEAQARTETRVNALAEAQARTEARLDQLTERVNALAEAQARTEARLDQLTERVNALAERVNELAAAQTRTEQRLNQLIAVIEKMERRLGRVENQGAEMRGYFLESRYRARAGSYWGKVLRRVRAYAPADLEEALEQRLPEAMYEELLNVDLVVCGFAKTSKELPEIWQAVEVSAVIDETDVRRAAQRARYLRQAGYLALPTVAGEKLAAEVATLAQIENVAILQDGQMLFWDAALAQALKERTN
jgi:small-conductance mechanosensitive channel